MKHPGTCRARIVLEAGAVLALAGCPRPGPAPERPGLPDAAPIVIVQRAADPCLPSPPPRWEPLEAVDAGCPPELICLTAVQANRLSANVERLKLYAGEAWLRCGPADGGGP